jgi:hypothetical protein
MRKYFPFKFQNHKAMGTKYYVAVRPQINENHAVHEESCPFLPDDEKRIYLGEFSSGEKAVKEGQRHFIKSKGCLFCSAEHDTSINGSSLTDWVKKEIFPVRIEIPVTYYEDLFCCLN